MLRGLYTTFGRLGATRLQGSESYSSSRVCRANRVSHHQLRLIDRVPGFFREVQQSAAAAGQPVVLVTSPSLPKPLRLASQPPDTMKPKSRGPLEATARRWTLQHLARMWVLRFPVMTSVFEMASPPSTKKQRSSREGRLRRRCTCQKISPHLQAESGCGHKRFPTLASVPYQAKSMYSGRSCMEEPRLRRRGESGFGVHRQQARQGR